MLDGRSGCLCGRGGVEGLFVYDMESVVMWREEVIVRVIFV